MKLRSFRVLFVLNLLIALILTACGGEATPTTSPTDAPAAAPTATTAAETLATATPEAAAAATATTAESQPTTAPAANTASLPAVIAMPEQIAGGRPVEITVVGMPPESQPTTLATWKEQVARFQQVYPNVTIIGSDYAYAPDTFAALVAGNQVPTLFEVYLTDVTKVVEQEIASDLTSVFSASKLDALFNPNIVAIASKDGKIYGIPRFAYAMGLGYNIDMLKTAGFDAPPTSWQELATMAKTLTNRDTNVAGFSFITDGGNATGWQVTTMAYTFGAKQADLVKTNSDGTYSAGFATGAPVDTLNYIKELRWNYDVLPRENLDWARNGEALATDRAALVVMAGDQFNWMRTTFPDVDLKKFGFAPLPVGPNAKSVSLVGGNIAMVNATADDDQKEAAAYFRLWTQFDPAEIQIGYDLSAKDPQYVIGAPVLPLYVGDYQTALDTLQAKYANLPVENYQLFRDAVTSGKVALELEPAIAGQEYYGAMGAVVSSILTDQAIDPAANVTEAATVFQQNVLDQLK